MELTLRETLQRMPKYMELVEKVRAIDPEAADWLLEHMDETNMADALPSCMMWRSTPQGFDYWCRIHSAIQQDPW